jgi:hypothetical protein
MNSFLSINGPMHNGIRPKTFFAGTKAIIKNKVMQAEVVPSEVQRKNYKEEETQSPFMKEIWTVLPWIAMTSILLFVLIF